MTHGSPPPIQLHISAAKKYCLFIPACPPCLPYVLAYHPPSQSLLGPVHICLISLKWPVYVYIFINRHPNIHGSSSIVPTAQALASQLPSVIHQSIAKKSVLLSHQLYIWPCQCVEVMSVSMCSKIPVQTYSHSSSRVAITEQQAAVRLFLEL